MPSKLDCIRELLGSCSTLALATAEGDGGPHSTPLFFVMDDAMRLYWFSSRRSLHSRHLAAHPEAAVAVFHETDRWQQIRGVQMRGAAAVVEDRERRREMVRSYCARFALGDFFGAAIRRSALYCFTPRWARYIDNTVRFGYKFELDLPAQGEN
ncbi:MAG: pyridoxamine 5'-phosphate oxidase family protein [Acidobacteriota bacterium]